MALRARKVTGAFEKRAPGLEPGPKNHEATAPPTVSQISSRKFIFISLSLFFLHVFLYIRSKDMAASQDIILRGSLNLFTGFVSKQNRELFD